MTKGLKYKKGFTWRHHLDEWWDRRPHEYRIRFGLTIFLVVVSVVGLVAYKINANYERKDMLQLAGEHREREEAKKQEVEETQRVLRERPMQVRENPTVRSGAEE